MYFIHFLLQINAYLHGYISFDLRFILYFIANGKINWSNFNQVIASFYLCYR